MSENKMQLTNISSVLKEHAKNYPESIAIITSKNKLTYQELDQTVQRYANLLRECGVKSGDKLALIISDQQIFITALLAAARLRIPVMPIPRSSTIQQRTEWMRSANINYLISDAAPIDVGSDNPVFIDSNWLESTTPSESHPDNLAGCTEDDLIFIIVVGSGTTGRSKLMPITHKKMLSRAETLKEMINVAPQDCVATMSHMEYAGPIHRLVCALLSKASFAIIDFERIGLMEWKLRYGITILSATVFHIHQMLEACRMCRTSTSRPLDGVRLSVSSSVVPENLRHEILDKLSTDLCIIYGTNEAWSVTVATPADLLRHPGSIGRPVPDVNVRIVDQQMEPVSEGHVGLIAIQSNQIIDGYLNDNQANEKAFREGWFLPGDLGQFTSDGQIIFCGRSDNMMIFNGINIFPIEIEQCLINHPDVVDVVAVPARHAVHQDIPVAAVVLRQGTKILADQLKEYAAAALGPKQPRRVIILEKIPRNSQGKVIKNEFLKNISDAILKNI